ncbi:Thioredoxin [bacterium A37T11]|nr:Thioredoxin [bacterium A37T11]
MKDINFFKSITCVLFCTLFSLKNSKAATVQDSIRPLQIGDVLPDSVWSLIPKETSTELIILDFWSTYCSACLEAVPHMENLARQFKGRLNVVLVNPFELKKQIDTRMAATYKRKSSYGLAMGDIFRQLPHIEGHPIFLQLFPANSVPHHVWLDGCGKVLYITDGHNATPAHVTSVLNKKQPEMALKNDYLFHELNRKPVLLPASELVPTFYYSAFIPFCRFSSSGTAQLDSAKGFFRNSTYNLDVISHFLRAFAPDKGPNKGTGMLYLILNTNLKDSLNQPTNMDLYDAWRKRYCFTYEIVWPYKEKDNWRDKYRHDLNDFFGREFGIIGQIERRELSFYVLKAKKNALKALLSTNGSVNRTNIQDDSLTLVHSAFRNMDTFLSKRLTDDDKGLYFLDETDLDAETFVNVNLQMDNRGHLAALSQQLKRYNLYLVKEKRKLDVLVIKDR